MADILSLMAAANILKSVRRQSSAKPNTSTPLRRKEKPLKRRTSGRHYPRPMTQKDKRKAARKQRVQQERRKRWCK